MATVTKENIGPLNEKITVKVEKDDYLPSFEKAIKSYSKKANIPGFRKGMVPTGIVKKMYGSSVFADEVIKTVEKSLQDFMEQEKLEIFAQPLPLAENDPSKLDMNQPSEYAFSFEVGLKPQLSLPDFGSMQVKKYKVTVTDDMLNEETDHLHKQHRVLSEAETVPAEDYELNVKLTEEAEQEESEGGINQNYYFFSTDFTPSFREQLSGKNKGESLIFQPAVALEEKAKEDFFKEVGINKSEPEAADKSLKLTIEKINGSKSPEMGIEFYGKVFPGEEILSEDEFRNKLREMIAQQWEGPSRNQLDDQIYHQLTDHVYIEFPESFLKRWLMNAASTPKTQEEVDKEYPGFVKSLQWSLITEKIIQENGIEVSREDIEAAAREQLMGYFRGNPGFDFDQPWVEDYVQRMMKDKKFVEDTARRTEVEKVFAWCETQVHPVETEVTAEEFRKLQEEHHHHH
ncbi:MAG: trigger factor [Williamsia sp.]|nr:trigger factor [Williamsia sp.]